MKIVGLVFLISYLYFFFKGSVVYNGKSNNDLGKRIFCSIYFGLGCAFCVGLPVWGIVALIKAIIF